MFNISESWSDTWKVNVISSISSIPSSTLTWLLTNEFRSDFFGFSIFFSPVNQNVFIKPFPLKEYSQFDMIAASIHPTLISISPLDWSSNVPNVWRASAVSELTWIFWAVTNNKIKFFWLHQYLRSPKVSNLEA